ncbi:MAG: hypothetical protein ACI8WB_000442 [Phenylobacterium sp.]|jgi:hypothetical protein
MSLSDLKKKSTRSRVSNCSVDEFINNANHYASGSPTAYDNVVSIKTGRAAEPGPAFEHVQATAAIDTLFAGMKQAALSHGNKKQPYRKATFTLSEQCIASLNQLSQQTGCSKSHLVRILIGNTRDEPT